MNNALILPAIQFDDVREQRLYDECVDLLVDFESEMVDRDNGHYYPAYIPSVADGDFADLRFSEDQGAFLGRHAEILLRLAEDDGVLAGKADKLAAIIDSGIRWAVYQALDHLNA